MSIFKNAFICYSNLPVKSQGLLSNYTGKPVNFTILLVTKITSATAQGWAQPSLIREKEMIYQKGEKQLSGWINRKMS